MREGWREGTRAKPGNRLVSYNVVFGVRDIESHYN